MFSTPNIVGVIEHGSWPKLRCGGLSNENFPSVDEVFEFLSVINTGGASFKATAARLVPFA